MSLSDQPPRPRVAAKRMLARLLLGLGTLIALLFVPAGRWNWPQAWVFVLCFGVFLFVYAFWGLYKDPDQLQERSQVAQNVKRWDKSIMGVYAALLPMVFILAGIDAGRFGWSVVPAEMQAVAWAGLALAGALIFWVVTMNTFLSRHARIQADRGQVVVTSGPYRYVRHPMYLAILVSFICLAPALGSWYAAVPAFAIDALFVVRTAKEDKMLREELPGYQDYAQRVRFRLIPGVW
jgi:protein-S-isoprenylcysteine O-methyltransferase Ste14